MSKKTSIYSPLSAIAPERKVLRFFDLFTLFFSFGIGLAVIQAGSILALGSGSLSFYSILVGSLVGTSLLSLVGTIGATTGLSSMASLKLSFGEKASGVPTIINILQLIGWGSFEIIIIRDSALFLLQNTVAPGSIWLSPVLWSILVGCVGIFLAMSGPLSVIRVVLKKFLIWLVLGSCIWLTWNLFQHINLGDLLTKKGTDLSFGLGTDMVIGMAFSFLPVIGDYTRFAKSPKQSFFGTVSGFCFANCWLMMLGAGYTVAFTQSSEINSLLLHLSMVGLGIPLILILINETDNIFIDVHSSSVSLALYLKKMTVKSLSIIVGIVCILIALFVDLGQYANFLVAICTVFAPLFGVIIFDYLYYIRRNIPLKGSWVTPSALTAWVFGIIIYQLCGYFEISTGNAIPSLLGAAFCKLIASQIVKKQIITD